MGCPNRSERGSHPAFTCRARSNADPTPPPFEILSSLRLSSRSAARPSPADNVRPHSSAPNGSPIGTARSPPPGLPPRATSSPNSSRPSLLANCSSRPQSSAPAFASSAAPCVSPNCRNTPASVVCAPRKIGLQANRLPQLRCSFRQFSLLLKNRAQSVMRLRIVRLRLQSAACISAVAWSNSPRCQYKTPSV